MGISILEASIIAGKKPGSIFAGSLLEWLQLNSYWAEFLLLFSIIQKNLFLVIYANAQGKT